MVVPTYEEAERKLRKYLALRGLRCTVERLAILKEVLEHKGHPSAEEIALQLSSGPLYVSRATVYRTLDLLVETGLLTCSTLGESHRHYEVHADHHDHLICRSCGRVIEIRSPEMEKLQDRICKENDFETVSHSLEIIGYCSRCRNGDQRENKGD
ncbi:transcriptional repressor [bacterium]|nr:transcriptional repressor [bacterium]